MSNHNNEPADEMNPFAPKVPVPVTPGERIARYAVWIAFLGASVAGIWFTRS